MKIGTAFPSKYLKASDIPEGEQVTVKIHRLSIEDVAGSGDPEDDKPVLYFQNKSKGLVLNKTNANTISQAYGDETDNWISNPVVLYATETTYQGRMVPCIRVRIARKAQSLTETLDDGKSTEEIPF